MKLEPAGLRLVRNGTSQRPASAFQPNEEFPLFGSELIDLLDKLGMAICDHEKLKVMG